MPEGICVLRSRTIASLPVYQEPSEAAEIIGMMHPTAMIEVVAKNMDGWYKIKTDEVNEAGNPDQKIGSGTAWLYETGTELFGACENLTNE